MAVITNQEKIREVLSRGVEKIYPSYEALEKVLMSGQRIRLYCGFDPSAEALHIGNAIQLNKLRQFQELGHEVIFLIGDFTGMIGDPTDKTATRKKLTREEVRANAKNYKKQAGAYLNFKGENPAQVMYNSKWSDKVTFKDLIEITSNFTVQQMIQRDMFQERMKDEKPIHFHEFLYPVAQGYDSVAMDVDLEIGGNDQMFNMMCGRDLMRAMRNKEKYVLTTKLLADPNGAKMGKTEGNAVFMNETPENVYGQVMSWPDGIIDQAFELATMVPAEEVKKIQEDLKNPNTNPRDLKMKLAFEITKIIHNQAKAKKAQKHFIKTVQHKEIPDEVRELSMSSGTRNIVDLLVSANLVASKGEARRLIEQGGIKINGEAVKDANMNIETKEGMIIQRGKRQFVKISIR
ncbi:MAG: tyrosine--tRNA ligase [Patescibacteria group bacterium]|jgi:tyrosyl-tRNA synthetase